MASAESDWDLLTRWRDGDRVAGEELFERHYASVERFFRNKVSTEVVDLVQKTFLTCVEKRDAVRGGSSYRTYLFGVANNVLRTHLRTKRRKQDPVDFGTMSAAALDPTPSIYVAEQEEQQLILLALREIPLQYQIVLELHYWERMERNDIAAALSIPAGTAGSRLRRGRELLAEALRRLTANPALLERTVTNLDQWAADLAVQVRDRNTT